MLAKGLLLYLAAEVAESKTPWLQIIITLVIGVTGAGFASVLNAIFGKKLTDAKADAQIVHNAQEIINELKERLAEVQADSKDKVRELNIEIQELKKTIQEERRLAQEEVLRLKSDIIMRDQEIQNYKQGRQ